MPPLAAKTGQPGFARGKQANLASLPVTPLASPLGDEGHEVAKGVQANWIHRGASRPANPVRRHPAKSVWTVVRMIMIFLFYVLSPPNVFAVHRFDRGPPIGGQENDRVSYLCSAPYTLLPLRGISPQGETRDMREKTASHILHVPFRCVPLWWLSPPPCSVESMSYDTESKSRNADFISIAAERQSTTLGPKGRQTYEP